VPAPPHCLPLPAVPAPPTCYHLTACPTTPPTPLHCTLYLPACPYPCHTACRTHVVTPHAPFTCLPCITLPPHHPFPPAADSPVPADCHHACPTGTLPRSLGGYTLRTPLPGSRLGHIPGWFGRYLPGYATPHVYHPLRVGLPARFCLIPLRCLVITGWCSDCITPHYDFWWTTPDLMMGLPPRGYTAPYPIPLSIPRWNHPGFPVTMPPPPRCHHTALLHHAQHRVCREGATHAPPV